MKAQIKVTQLNNNQFIVTTEHGKVHILTNRALKWNLKHVFGLKGDDVLAIMVAVGMNQFTEVVVDIAS